MSVVINISATLMRYVNWHLDGQRELKTGELKLRTLVVCITRIKAKNLETSAEKLKMNIRRNVHIAEEVKKETNDCTKENKK
jgi:hypothetical protein